MKRIAVILTALVMTIFQLNAEVNSDGSYSYSYPLELPPAICGPAPQISIDYNSNSPNGVCGIGWSLNYGGMAITEDTGYGYNQTGWMKDTQPRYQTPWGIVEYSYGVYKTKDSFVKMTITYDSPNNRWIVITEDGTTYYFARIKEKINNTINCKNLWMVQQVEDRFGQKYEITYMEISGGSNSYVPQTIKYGKNGMMEVRFEYAARNDVIHSNYAGISSMDKRLSKISMYAKNTYVRSYTLTYDDNVTYNKSFLNSIKLDSSDGSQTTSFTWNKDNGTSQIPGDPGLFQSTSQPVFREFYSDPAWNWNWDDQVVVGDFDGDNLYDKVIVHRDGADLHDLCLLTIRGNAKESNELVYSWYSHDDIAEISTRHFDKNYAMVSGDFDGDGQDDLLLVKHSYEYEVDGYDRYKTLQIQRFYSEYENGEWTSFKNIPLTNLERYGDWENISLPPSVLTGDFNNDGRTDFMIIANWNCKESASYQKECHIRLFISECEKTTQSFMEYTIDLTLYYAAKYEFLTPDVNGDGRSDLVFARGAGTAGREIITYLSIQDGVFMEADHMDTTGGTVSCSSLIPQDGGYYLFPNITYADVNGDGMMDITGFNTVPRSQAMTEISKATGSCPVSGTGSTTVTVSGSAPPYYTNPPVSEEKYATNTLSTGYGYVNLESLQYPALYTKSNVDYGDEECTTVNTAGTTCEKTCITVNHRVWTSTAQYADLNRDGFADRVSFETPYFDENDDDSVIYPRVVIQWGNSQGQYLTDGKHMSILWNNADETYLFLAYYKNNSWKMSLEDYNDDGLLDIVFYSYNENNNGDIGFFEEALLQQAVLTPLLTKITDGTGGKQEISYKKIKTADTNPDGTYLSVQADQTPSIVVDGINEYIDDTLIKSESHTYGDKKRKNGGFKVRYGGIFESHKITTTTQMAAGAVTMVRNIIYNIDDKKMAGTIKEDVSTVYGKELKKENTYAILNIDGRDKVVIQNQTFTDEEKDLKLYTEYSFNEYGDIDQTIEYLYYASNPPKISITNTNYSYPEIITANSYPYYPENYLTISESSTVSVDGTVKSNTSFSETKNGANTIHESYSDSGSENGIVRTKRAVLDANGMLIESEDALGNKTSYSYDFSNSSDYPGSYLVGVTRGGISTYTRYDYSRGKKVYEKYPDGREFSYTYESLYGRITGIFDLAANVKISETEYTGLTIKKTTTTCYADYGYSVEYPARSDYDNEESYLQALIDSILNFFRKLFGLQSLSVVNSVTETITYNSRGQITNTEKKTLIPQTGDEIIYISETVYNIDGSINNLSIPHTASESVLYTRYTYDVRGRVKTKTMTDGGIYTYYYDLIKGSSYYSQKTSVTYQKNGKQYTSWTEVFPITKKTVKHEPNGNEITYETDNASNTKTIINTEGSVTTVVYNKLGWKLSLDDPNTGKYEYTYYDNGQLKTQTDPLGTTVTYTYDDLGRSEKTVYERSGMLSKTVEYLYESGTGLLSEVLEYSGDNYMTDGNSVRHLYEYINGKPSMVERKIHDLSFKYVMRYDTDGRVIRMMYPNKYEIAREYSDGEYLNSVKSLPSKSNIVTYGKIRVTDDGIDTSTLNDDTVYRITGDNIETAISYDPATFKVNSIVSTRTKKYDTELQKEVDDDTVIENLSYEYDYRGNVERVNDFSDSGKLNATYSFDNLNRIEEATGTFGTNGVPLSFTYSDEGNLESKDVGITLSYEADFHPHAVTKMTKDGKGYNYRYDAMGNMVIRRATNVSLAQYDATGYLTDGQLLEYDITGKLAKVSGTNLPTENYLYDFTGSRIWKQYRQSGKVISTYTIDGLFERTEFDGGSAQDTVYIAGMKNELVMQYTKASGTYLSMIDSEVYENVFDRSTFRGFTKYAYYCISDHVLDPDTPKTLLLILMILMFGFCGYRFWHTFQRRGIRYALNHDLNVLMVLFFFTSFAAFQGCFFVETAETETPEWATEDGGGTSTTAEEAEDSDSAEAEWGAEEYGETSEYWESDNTTYDTSGIPETGVLFFHPNYTGNISYTTNSNGEVQSRILYRPYGETTVAGDDNYRSKFNTHESDKTGLMYFNARYYDPEIGRFITADTEIPNPEVTQAFNRYMFVCGNPINFRDSSGHCIFAALLIAMVIGACIGGAIGGTRGHVFSRKAYVQDWDWGGFRDGAIIGAAAGLVVMLTGVTLGYLGTAIGGSTPYMGATLGSHMTNIFYGGVLNSTLQGMQGENDPSKLAGYFAAGAVGSGLAGSGFFGMAKNGLQGKLLAEAAISGIKYKMNNIVDREGLTGEWGFGLPYTNFEGRGMKDFKASLNWVHLAGQGGVFFNGIFRVDNDEKFEFDKNSLSFTADKGIVGIFLNKMGFNGISLYGILVSNGGNTTTTVHEGIHLWQMRFEGDFWVLNYLLNCGNDESMHMNGFANYYRSNFYEQQAYTNETQAFWQ